MKNITLLIKNILSKNINKFCNNFYNKSSVIFNNFYNKKSGTLITIAFLGSFFCSSFETKCMNQNSVQTNAFIQNLCNNSLVNAHKKISNNCFIINVKTANQGDPKINGYGGTCPSMALRACQLKLNFFLTGNIKYLKNMQSIDNAKIFLENMVTNNLQTSDLHGENIKNMLTTQALSKLNQYNNLTDIKINCNTENTFEIDNIDWFKKDYLSIDKSFSNQIDTIRFLIKNSENGFAFVFNTGGHWIDICVIKIDGIYYWLVSDSGGGDHTDLAQQFIEVINVEKEIDKKKILEDRDYKLAQKLQDDEFWKKPLDLKKPKQTQKTQLANDKPTTNKGYDEPIFTDDWQKLVYGIFGIATICLFFYIIKHQFKKIKI